MSFTSKLKEAWIGIAAGTVTLPYPLAPHPPAPGFRGRPVFDASRCIGCGGCASNCPAREILLFDPCQELRVLRYLGRRCTSCGRCAEVCPEKAITMSDAFELATPRKAGGADAAAKIRCLAAPLRNLAIDSNRKSPRPDAVNRIFPIPHTLCHCRCHAPCRIVARISISISAGRTVIVAGITANNILSPPGRKQR